MDGIDKIIIQTHKYFRFAFTKYSQPHHEHRITLSKIGKHEYYKYNII